MNLKTKMLCAFTVLLFIGSLAIGSVSVSYTLSGTASNEQFIPAETYGDDRRNEAVNILIYTEFTDLDPGGEWDNTMSSMIGSLEGKFTYDNLTDYTQLGSVIDEYDILLLTENELGNFSTSDMIVGVWDSILPSFVLDGGIVICMTYESPTNRGTTARILNGTGLMELYNPGSAFAHQLNLIDTNDALARNMPSSYTGASGSTNFDTTDGVVVMEDNTNGKAVVVHKTIGKGHVVLLGFDMFTSGVAEQDTLLQNAILLHRHVVFDNSHGQYKNVNSGLNAISSDLPDHGFSVSSMNTFDPAILEACEILVISYCTNEYNATEIDMIADFVSGGGGLFIVTEWTYLGDATDNLMNHFGFVRNTTAKLYDSDDSGIYLWFIDFYPENLNMHSTKVGVDVIETYAPTALIEIPESAVPLITTDTDNTTTWGGVEEANGLPVAAADLVGAGRIVILTDEGLLTDSDADGDATINYYDSDNEIFTRNAFRWLSGAGIPEQTVVFDQSHNPFKYIHSEYNQFANLLMFNGYNVEWINIFNPTAFEDADILFICDGSLDYNTTEIANITDFVSEGGALLLWGDHSSYSWQIDPIAQEFGLQVNLTGWFEDTDDYVSYASYIAYDGGNIGAHPIMDGVERLEVSRSTGFISIGSGTALVSTDSDSTSIWNDGSPAINIPVFAATTFNMGRVVFLTDVNLAEITDTDSDGFGNIYDSDNPVFVANVFKWLAENRAPTVEVIAPNGGAVLNGTITINWEAADFDSDPLTFDVFYSDNNGSDWTLLASGLSVTEYEWNTNLVANGTDYLIRVVASDGELTSEDVSDGTFTVEHPAPTTTTTTTTTTGGGLPINPTLLIIIAAGGIIIVIIIVIVMKKKK